jgi:ribosomal protein S18 acetylase RimI-like enzyme
MGASLDGTFRDATLFSALFARPYLDYPAAVCRVAADGPHVTGYCVAAPDTGAFETWWSERRNRTVTRCVLGHTLWRSPHDLVWLARWSRRGPPDPALEARVRAAYPAHLHINVAPGHHHAGIGTALLESVMGALRAQNARGVHLKTSTANDAALRFYAKHGFRRLHSTGGSLWGLPGVATICMGRTL